MAVVMADGHQSNMSFFNSKFLKNKNDICFENTFCPGSKIYPMFDNTHLFKNFYNNWRGKPTFECPLFPISESSETTSTIADNIGDAELVEATTSSETTSTIADNIGDAELVEATTSSETTSTIADNIGDTELVEATTNSETTCISECSDNSEIPRVKANIFPSFAHIHQLYEIEKTSPEKMAYKLNEKVLNPQVMEKTNVKLADAVFHESTINALNYYAEHGYENFKDSAEFAKTVRDWFNTVNVKSTDHGNRKRDERRKPIRRETVDEDLSYIQKFVEWLEKWKKNGTHGLSNPTFKAAIRSCRATIALVHYLFDRYENLDYILLGNISSDFLEGRFGWWRQMCGGNYYNSVVQFLQAEKTIRIRSLVSMGYDMSQIKEIFQPSNKDRDDQQKEEIKCFVNELDGFKLTNDHVLKDNEKSILYYIAGYIAKCLAKEKCEDCNELFTPGNVPIKVVFDSSVEGEDDSSVKAKEDFINSVSRGGLRKPSDSMYVSCVHASSLNRYIFKNEDIKKSLLATKNPRDTFIECFLKILENDDDASGLITMKCAKGHTNSKYLQRVAFTIFNINAKNYVSELNDQIHLTRKRAAPAAKSSKSARKVRKLQNQGST